MEARGTPKTARGHMRRAIVSASLGLLAIATMFAIVHVDAEEDLFRQDALIASDNAVMVLASLSIVWGTLWVSWQRCRLDLTKADPISIALIGMAVESVGWAIHRGYWFVWRLARDRDFWELAEAIESGLALWITGIAFVLIVTGALMVINPFTRVIFGRFWFLSSSIIAVLLWGAMYQMIGVVPPALN